MKNVLSTYEAPQAIGPYSQAIEIDNLLFVSGQLGLEPESGKMVEGGVEAQAEQAMQNISAILDEAGLTFSNIVKTTIFLADMNDFAKVNEVYAGHFVGDFPARSAIQVAGLPKGGLVEIEVIAVKDL